MTGASLFLYLMFDLINLVNWQLATCNKSTDVHVWWRSCSIGVVKQFVSVPAICAADLRRLFLGAVLLVAAALAHYLHGYYPGSRHRCVYVLN